MRSAVKLGAGLTVCAALLATQTARAAGPGFGNSTYGDAELWQPIAYFDSTNGALGGTNVPLFINGYLLLHFAPDGGKPGTGLAIYDVSDPRSPRLVASVQDEHTAVLRETHSLPLAHIGGRDYVVLQAVAGVQIWDVTDPATPAFTALVDLPGCAGGDYDNAAWWTTWQGPYIYVAGLNNGLYIVDARDPAQPTLATTVPTGSTGGFKIGPVFAMGNRLVFSNASGIVSSYGILDISDPLQPFLIQTLTPPGDLSNIYASTVLGTRIYGLGRFQTFSIIAYDDDMLRVAGQKTSMGPASYGSVQDNFVHYGGQQDYRKVDVTDETNPNVVGSVVLSGADVDHGQAFALGNLIYIGNDHGTGSALAVHQTAPDTTPPSVVWSYPKDQQVAVAASDRISISFSDYLDFATVGPMTISVTRAGGEIVEGIYSYWANTVSFGPAAPWEPDTSYRVVVHGGGVRDVASNAVTTDTTFAFSTGTTPPGEMGSDGATGDPAGSSCACRSARAAHSTFSSWLLALAVLAACKLRRTRSVGGGAEDDPVG